MKSGKRTTAEERLERLDSAYDVCADKGYAKVCDMADYLGVEEKTVRTYLKEYEDIYSNDRGIVTRTE